MQFALRVKPRLSWAMLGRLTLPSLAVPATGLFLPSLQGLQLGDELGLPGCEVGLDAAMLALNCIAVALPSGQHPLGTEHPEPFVNVRADLQERRGRGRGWGTEKKPQPTNIQIKNPICPLKQASRLHCRNPVIQGHSSGASAEEHSTGPNNNLQAPNWAWWHRPVNLAIQGLEVRRSQVQGFPGLYSKFKASLGNL